LEELLNEKEMELLQATATGDEVIEIPKKKKFLKQGGPCER
jgi:hypothetical protein